MPVAKTNEEYYEEASKINPHIKITGIYHNGGTKMHCECKTCHYEWTSAARNLLKKKKCYNCILKERTFVYPDITHEEFCNIIKEYYPDLVVTGKYKKNRQTIACKCNKCGYKSRVRTQKLLEHTYECPICTNGKENIEYGVNDIKTVNPVLYECLKDKSDVDKYTINSGMKVDFICPSCHHIIKNKTIKQVNRRGLKCKCQDGNSLGEKYFYQVIKSLDEKVEVEKYLNDNPSFRYDFYGEVNGKTWICEIQGKQHTTKSFETCNGRTLKEEQENDKRKKEYALSQGIDYYIEINSKESGFNQLKHAILKSKLVDLYNFDNVDWVSCYRRSLTSDIVRVAELWNQGYKVLKIASIVGIGRSTVRKHLTKANEIGLCNYDHTVSNRVKVICLDTGEIFKSLRDAERKYNIKRGRLSGYLKGKLTCASVANKRWDYYNESTVLSEDKVSA